MLLDKTGYVSQETRPKFIDSQNFYFHFHFKLFCIEARHLSDELSLMYPRLWPIEDKCIGLYVLKCLLNVRHILEKVMSLQHSFEEVSEKQRRDELKSVGNFVAKTVLVESANHWKSCVWHSIVWNIFRSHIDHQTLWKNLKESCTPPLKNSRGYEACSKKDGLVKSSVSDCWSMSPSNVTSITASKSNWRRPGAQTGGTKKLNFFSSVISYRNFQLAELWRQSTA